MRAGEGEFGGDGIEILIVVLKSFSLVATYGIDMFPLRFLYQ
jgi:hypothetical protein